ncbi:type II toxin-antitoxin system VapC family toxin [Isoptericola sp. NPDC019482]|uniref:type II toxin-antitoxin system VapC family toxin n=1 Tax=Isoptericola sp. NPDC019482 TaxID=3154688 RepID=UPI00348B9C09
MIVLDASVVIAYLEPTDAHHESATELVVDLVADGEHDLVLHPLTAAEVLAGFVRFGTEEQAWADLASIGFVVRGLGEGPAAALLIARTRMQSRLKMPDAVVLATALHHGGVVASYDDALRAAAGKHGVLYAAGEVR